MNLSALRVWLTNDSERLNCPPRLIQNACFFNVGTISTPSPRQRDSMNTALPNPDDKLRNWVAERDLRDTMEHERRERFVTEKYRGAFLIMTLVAILQITVLVLVAKGVPFTGANSAPADSGDKASLARITEADRQITLERFDRLQTGLSYQEVCQVVGVEGQELARCHFKGEPGAIEPLETVVYAWINADGSRVNATFQNDRLIAYSHSGLPSAN